MTHDARPPNHTNKSMFAAPEKNTAAENSHPQPAALEPRVLEGRDGVPHDGHHAGPDLPLPVSAGAPPDIDRLRPTAKSETYKLAQIPYMEVPRRD